MLGCGGEKQGKSEAWRLEDALEEKWSALLFVRAVWCPFISSTTLTMTNVVASCSINDE